MYDLGRCTPLWAKRYTQRNANLFCQKSVTHLHFCFIFMTPVSFQYAAVVVAKSCTTLLWPRGLQPFRLLCLWDFPSKNTGVGCHCLFQGIFPTQLSNLRLLHLQANSLSLSHQRSPAFKIVLCKSKKHLVFFTSLFFFPVHSLTWKLILHFCKLFNFFSFLTFGWIGSSLWHGAFSTCGSLSSLLTEPGL